MALLQGADPRGVPQRDLPRPARRPRRTRRRRRRPRVLPQGDPPAHAGGGRAPGRDGARAEQLLARRRSRAGADAPRRGPGADARARDALRGRLEDGPRRDRARAAGHHRGAGRTLLHGLRAARARAALGRRDRERRRPRSTPRSIRSCSASPRRRSIRGLDRLETQWPRLGRPEPTDDCRPRWWRSTRPPARSARSSAGATTRSASTTAPSLARRQPGSAFKPFVYLAALRTHGGPPALTAASIVDDSPITLTVGNRHLDVRATTATATRAG